MGSRHNDRVRRMAALFGSAAIALFLYSGAATPLRSQPWSVVEQKEVIKSWELPVCYVVSHGDSTKYGSGFLMGTADSNMFLFFTALHVVQGSDSVQVQLGIYDGDCNRRRWEFRWVPHEAGQRVYYVSDPSYDCAWIPIRRELIVRGLPATWRFWFVKKNQLVPVDSLCVGLPVVFAGYPAGLSVGSKVPVVRFGRIAAIGLDPRQVLLDANVFQGSSGSPVLLDKTDPRTRAFEGSLVGLIFENLDVLRQSPESQFRSTENLGIGCVVPADVLLRSVELFEKPPQR
ncbi:MAG: serine protease [Candidatus Zixiibacteriota bacterium]